MSTPWPTLSHSYYHLPPLPDLKPSHSFIRIWLILHSHIRESKSNKTLALEVRLTLATVNLFRESFMKYNHQRRYILKLNYLGKILEDYNLYFWLNLFCNLNNFTQSNYILRQLVLFVKYFCPFLTASMWGSPFKRSFFCMWVKKKSV